MVYKNNKRIKNGLRNLSFLGCLNNRMQQMPKMAKTVALRLAEKAREEKANELKQQQKNQNRNVRNNSTNAPSSNNHLRKQNSLNGPNHTSGSQPPQGMNKSNNVIRRVDNGMVKLPKVSTIGNSSVSNTSMKAIWEGSKRNGQEGGSREERRK